MLIVLTGGVAILLTAGFKKTQEQGGNPALQFSSTASSDQDGKTTNSRECEINGEVYFPYDRPNPGNHARVGAIVDGLRRIAILQKTFGKSASELPDTVICKISWGKVHLDSRSIYSKKGILLSDEVALTLEDAPANIGLWRLSSLRLVSPASEEDPHLDTLTDLLGTLGFMLVKNRRIGRDIWQETIRWTQVSE